jgi:hypothetical protein
MAKPAGASQGPRPLPVLAAGLAVLAAGALLAFLFLPEWRARPSVDPGALRAEFRRMAETAGVQLAPGTPQVELAARRESREKTLQVRVSHGGRRPGDRKEGRLEMSFSKDGRLRSIEWATMSISLFSTTAPSLLEEMATTFSELLLTPGESLGEAGPEPVMGASSFDNRAVVGSSPPEVVQIFISPPVSVSVERTPGGPGEQPDRQIRQVLLLGAMNLPVWLAIAGLFLALLLRARIDVVNGAILALLGLASAHPDWFREAPGNLFFAAIFFLFAAPGKALWVFLVWSAGESLLRSTDPGFTTSLDTLRLGRIGPRVGRSLLLGLGFGAALAGLRLGVSAAAPWIPGVALESSSLPLPVFRAGGSPISNGIALAAGVALALALAVRLLPRRWATLPAAALAAGYVLGPLDLSPFGARLAVNAVFAGLLAWICRRFGLTALLVAAVSFYLLPALLASGLHPGWMPVSFGITAAATAAIVLVGFVGFSRPEEVETGYMAPPPFIRRLAEERRVRNEVDLLARMQTGLLPQELPRIEGYDLAARSVLASEAGGDLYDFLRDEAGRLWIAAGDVAGHGYSCAIAQAMIKAGLVSLIAPEESPAEVLRQLHRVLQGVSTGHGFTSLALLRLDPGTGEAVLANAAYPYPLLFTGGRVAEIELPGLPLGHGPARTYSDRVFHLPPGSVLALCSDGLFEVLDRNGNAYGFERAREVLQAIGHRPAVEIVDTLLNDCRRHVGGGELPDDVTVVVVRRG